MNDLKISFFQKYNLLIISFIFLMGAGCASTQKTLDDPSTNATLWMQNSAEYKALTMMVYQMASAQLDDALQNSSESADLEQQKSSFSNLSPAIIVDVDETVLDNSPFQARLIKQNESYSPEKWNQWVREEKADAIPGALSFTQEAAQKGITIFYITNRDASLEKSTFDNLKKQGFPLIDSVDVLLTNHEHDNWTSAKVNRRKFVAKNYRILMLFGDNLNDFLLASDITQEKRLQLVEKYKKKFGTKWFILPNPVYGSWQQALYDFDSSLSARQINQREKDMLHTKK